MAIQKFPVDPSQMVGKFWLPGASRQEKAAGVCRVEAGVIEVDLPTPLTPGMEAEEILPGITANRPTADESDFVVHGRLPIAPGDITFLGVRTTGRTTLLSTHADQPELHRLQAEWCIAGTHVASLGQKFDGIRARFTHLEQWALASDLSLEAQHTPSTTVTLRYAPSETLKTDFSEFGESATLQIAKAAQLPAPSVWGGSINTYNWLELTDLTGWTLHEGIARFVRPVQSMLTMAAERHCDITHLEVRVGGLWLPVFGELVRDVAERPGVNDMLFTRFEMSLETVARWCGLATRLAPAPNVVASAIAGEFTALESQALALTTTAEGLDRSLRPGARRFSVEDVAAASAAVNSAADIPEGIRTSLVDALEQYWHEPSYPMRLERLATEVGAVAPDCIGKASRWKKDISDLRVTLAHSIDNSRSDDEVMKMYARVLTLRWTLLVRLLIEAGVDDDALRTCLASSKRFSRDSTVWTRELPRTYSASGSI